jgi:hypothetical protein
LLEGALEVDLLDSFRFGVVRTEFEEELEDELEDELEEELEEQLELDEEELEELGLDEEKLDIGFVIAGAVGKEDEDDEADVTTPFGIADRCMVKKDSIMAE